MCLIANTDLGSAKSVVQKIEYLESFRSLCSFFLILNNPQTMNSLAEGIGLDEGSTFRLGLTGNSYTEKIDFWESVGHLIENNNFNLEYLKMVYMHSTYEVRKAIPTSWNPKNCRYAQPIIELRNLNFHPKTSSSLNELEFVSSVGNWTFPSGNLFPEPFTTGPESNAPTTGDVHMMLSKFKEHLEKLIAAAELDESTP